MQILKKVSFQVKSSPPTPIHLPFSSLSVPPGAEELDNDSFDISTLRKPVNGDPSLILQDPSKYALPEHLAPPGISPHHSSPHHSSPGYLVDPHLGHAAPPLDPAQWLQQAPMTQQQQPPNKLEDVNDFIHKRLREADEDPASPPFDTILEFNDEGAGSTAGMKGGGVVLVWRGVA